MKPLAHFHLLQPTARRTKRTLAVMAFSVMLGCSSRTTPATPSTSSPIVLRLHGTSSTSPLIAELSAEYTQTHPDLTFQTGSANYDTMMKRLLAGEIPYFLSSHLDVEEDPKLWAAPIGQDGIAVIVNPANRIAELSIEQIRRIYQGTIVNWKEVGGRDEAIVVLSREEGSGTRIEFERQVMGQRRTTANAQVVPSSGAMHTRVAELPNAIGYISMSHLTSEVKAMQINGILPSPETVYANTYALRSTLFVIGLEEPQDHHRALIAWMQGLEGQGIISRHYAPLP